jgi:TATA-box binding protein (TBP) (component of TFIID and TFIIIB)
MKQYINPSKFDTTKIPNNTKVSTMSITCKIGTNIYIKEISRFMRLSTKDVLTIKYYRNIRSLDAKVIKKHNKKRHKLGFFNQLTVEVRLNPQRKINIKLFRNGSLQMSGCKSVNDCNIVLNKLLTRITKVKARIVNNKIREVKFVENPKDINITDFRIIMINSGFRVDYNIDRQKLYDILEDQNVNCKYEPRTHACVNIKHTDTAIDWKTKELVDKDISIFVFESGSILITGSNCVEHIANAYEYITQVLEENYDNIIKNNINKLLDCIDDRNIQELLED